MHQTKFFGMTLYTDNAKLVELLELMANDPGQGLAEKFDATYPGFRVAAASCCKEIEAQRCAPAVVIYRNLRIQAWADSQFDCEPSTVRKVVPV